jgi:chaperonin GroEL (HSP60 family)
VPGAGLALLRAIPAVEAEAARVEGGERAGALILRRALEAPARQIAENSGVDGGVVVEKMRGGTGNFGFDAASGKSSIWSRRGSSTRRTSSDWRWRTPCQRPACCCRPRRR